MVQVKSQEVSVRIRWVIKNDLPALLAISKESFTHAWTESEFRARLGDVNNIAIVAVRGEVVVGT